MKSRILVIVLVISLALNIGALVTFGYFLLHEEPAVRQEKGFKTCCQGLSKEEFEKIASLEKVMQERNKPLKEQMSRKRQELLSLLREPALDTAKRDSILKQMAELQVSLELSSFDYLRELKATLPPENQEMLLEFVEGCFCNHEDSCVCPYESKQVINNKEK